MDYLLFKAKQPVPLLQLKGKLDMIPLKIAG